MSAASLLLDCWEATSRSGGPQRSAALLLPTARGMDLESAAALPVGRRDARLLELRRRLFGEDVEALAHCPGCGLTVELSFRVSDIVASGPPKAPSTAEYRGWSIDFRLPDSRDLQTVASCMNLEDARRLLIERCVLKVTSRSRQRTIGETPAELIGLMEDAMAGADPQADTHFNLSCPGCQASWEADFDTGAFVADEIAAGAKRLLSEVHQLAVAYGWSESDILGLAPQRRLAYLELVGAE